jgi:hypothetical protein
MQLRLPEVLQSPKVLEPSVLLQRHLPMHQLLLVLVLFRERE